MTSDSAPYVEWRSRILSLLVKWAAHAEQYWYEPPDAPGPRAWPRGRIGCYGTGYNAWGVQTNQKYVSAMAVLGTLGEKHGLAPSDATHANPCQLACERALAALRFSLHSHVSGEGVCTDGTRWGHTWISSLGIERMMHGVYLLDPFLDDGDRAALRRVLSSEADWILESYHRGAQCGVVGDVWNHTGRNAPESNLWNGALLWRASAMYPDHPHAAAWQQKAHHFLVNAVSVPADAADHHSVAGRPVREWHAGANFFPSYALDHHGYLNVGYMFICLSNAAMLHFDMKHLGLPAPESLYHHQADLWSVSRRLLFSDGRLARVGGDSRVRYAYCQEYALPSLLYAADAFQEPFAAALLTRQLGWIEQEAAFSAEGDPLQRGSFYGRRLRALVDHSPYYYTRLESDRACALGMVLAFLEQMPTDGVAHERIGPEPDPGAGQAFEASVTGTWCEPAHGLILHRCPSRLASFSWRAYGLGQGMCQPPDDGHLAEWSHNLCGLVRFQGDGGADWGPSGPAGVVEGDQMRHRRVLRHEVHCFEGGFATWGAIAEGVDLEIAEGWHGDHSATHQVAFVALPDARTVVGLQFCQTARHRAYACEVKGLHLNVPNDLYNGFRRSLQTEVGTVTLQAPAKGECLLDLDSTWACVEGRVGVLWLYGDGRLTVHRAPYRRGGKYASLYVDQISLGCTTGVHPVDPETVVLDCGWAVLSRAGPEQTSSCARSSSLLDVEDARVRAVRVRGADHWYAIVANWGNDRVACPASALLGEASWIPDLVGYDLIHRRAMSRQDELALLPGQVGVVALWSR